MLLGKRAGNHILEGTYSFLKHVEQIKKKPAMTNPFVKKTKELELEQMILPDTV